LTNNAVTKQIKHFDTLHILKGDSFKNPKNTTCSNSVYVPETLRTASWFHMAVGVCVSKEHQEAEEGKTEHIW